MWSEMDGVQRRDSISRCVETWSAATRGTHAGPTGLMPKFGEADPTTENHGIPCHGSRIDGSEVQGAYGLLMPMRKVGKGVGVGRQERWARQVSRGEPRPLPRLHPREPDNLPATPGPPPLCPFRPGATLFHRGPRQPQWPGGSLGCLSIIRTQTLPAEDPIEVGMRDRCGVG